MFVVHIETKITRLDRITLELDDLEILFTPFGRLSKILIFDRHQQVRSFIEFE